MRVIRAVLAERTTISDAAKELGIARVNMQTLVHRVEAAIVTTLQPRATGRAPTSSTERQLKAQVTQLEKENAKLKRQLQAADDMMMAAGEIIRSLAWAPAGGLESVFLALEALAGDLTNQRRGSGTRTSDDANDLAPSADEPDDEGVS